MLTGTTQWQRPYSLAGICGLYIDQKNYCFTGIDNFIPAFWM